MFFLRNKIPRPPTHTHAVTVTLTSWGETHLEKLITPEGDHTMLMLCGQTPHCLLAASVCRSLSDLLGCFYPPGGRGDN